MTNNHTHGLLLGALLLGTTTLLPPSLEAQGKPLPRNNIIPGQPLAVLHVDGPARLRTTFLPTNIGRMFAGKEMQQLMEPVFAVMADWEKEVGADAPFDMKDLQKSVKAYGGRVTFAFHLLGEPKGVVQTEQAPMSLTVTFAPDGGTTNLAEWCKKMRTAVEESEGARIGDLEIEGQKFIASQNSTEERKDWDAVLPFMHKGFAVFVLSNDLENAVRRVLNPDNKETYAATEPIHTSSIAIDINVQAFNRYLQAALANQGEVEFNQEPIELLKAMMKHSGLLSLDRVDMSFRAIGPNLATETGMNFNDKPRGMLGALVPEQRGPSPFLNTLPRSAGLASTFFLDVPRLYDSIKVITDEVCEATGEEFTFERLEEMFEDNAGVRLKEDLIGLLGKHHIMIERFGEEDDEESGSVCMGFSVSDIKKFQKSIDTMLREQGMHAARKKDEYKGFLVYRQSIAGIFEASYGYTDKMFLLAFGRQGAKALRSVLDREVDRKAGKEPAPFTPGITRRLRTQKDGYLDLGWVNMRRNLDALAIALEGVEQTLGMLDVPEGLETVLAVMTRLGPILKDYKLDEQVTVTQRVGNRHISRTIW